MEEEFRGFLEGERVFVAGFGAEGFDLEILERGLGGFFNGIYVVRVPGVPARVLEDLVYVVVEGFHFVGVHVFVLHVRQVVVVHVLSVRVPTLLLVGSG